MGTDGSWAVIIVQDGEPGTGDLAPLLGDRFAVRCVKLEVAGVIAAIRRRRPDVVLVDLGRVREPDGVTLAEELFVCEDVPVVLVSSIDDLALARRATRSGAYGYLTRPLGATALNVTLELAIHKHEDLRARRGEAQRLLPYLDGISVAVVGLDQHGVVQIMNRAAAQLTGWMYLEAKDSEPPWAHELERLPSSSRGLLEHHTTLTTRADGKASVAVQKYPLSAGHLYLLRPG